MRSIRVYLDIEVLPSTLSEFGIGGQAPPHAVPEPIQKDKKNVNLTTQYQKTDGK
jgi:hypothetical protein